jgi:conjugative relaxase-like TrwC/TraI family protein
MTLHNLLASVMATSALQYLVSPTTSNDTPNAAHVSRPRPDSDSTRIRFPVVASCVPSNSRQESNAPGCRNGAHQATAGHVGAWWPISQSCVGREDYYVREVANNREEYLSGHGESPGRWLGRGAATLGQHGTATTEAFVNVFHGRHPETGELLGRAHGDRGVPAFDVVLRPTKSVSLLYGLADARTAAQVLDAHQEATREALGYLEEHVGTRRGHGGCDHVAAQGLLAVGFDHRTSRAGDPLLHTHVIVANRVQGPDGRWTALDGRDLYRHRLAADTIYRGCYQRALSRSLGVAWTEPDRYGNRELVGMPSELLRVFSKRADAIDCEVERLQTEGRVRTPKLVKWVVHATRQAKRHEAPATLAERWRGEAAEHGVDVSGLLCGVLGRDRQATSDPAGAGGPVVGDPAEEAVVAGVFDRLASPEGLTAQASTFARQDVIAALGDRLVGADRAQLEGLADRFLAERAVSVVAERTLEERRWSTPELLQVEHDLVDAALWRRGTGTAPCSAETVRAALAAHPTIGDDQAGMVRDLCLSGDGVRVVVGKAGTGKTYALGVARHVFTLDGYRVIGAAPTGIATTSLEAEGFEEVATVDRLLLELDQETKALRTGRLVTADRDRGAGGRLLDARSVLVVDEAGMVGSRKLARLLEHVNRAGAKVVLVGDDRQLASIDAGGGFRGLRVWLGASELTENRRQRQAWERDALELVRDGQVEQAVEAYREHERMVPATSKTELTLNLVREWWQAHRDAEAGQGGDAVILAYRRDEVDRLNTTCQQVMRRNGRLGPEQLEVGDRTLHVGDRVVCGRNDLKGLGVANGTRGTVTGVDVQRRALTMRTEQGREVTLPAAYLDARVPEGRRVVDLAYATTGHKAQGLTRWRALVRITGHEDANWLYVQLSRAQQDTRLHTIVAPEPHAGEVDLPDREPPDAYEQLAAALARQGGQELAIDTRSRLDVRATPTKELRAERDRLRTELDQAPPDRRRVLERATQRRQQAEQDLAAVEAKHPAEGGWRLFGRRGEREQDQAARMLAARQAERAAQAEVAARAAQQEHQGWLEANHDLGGDYRGVSGELALRSRQRVVFAELEQPAYLRDALGSVPESVRGRRAWRQTARAVEDYRQRFQVSDPERPLGAEPARDADADRYAAWREASGAVARMRARQQHREFNRTRSPGSVRSIADHSGGESTRPHDRTREPDPVQGAERAVG